MCPCDAAPFGVRRFIAAFRKHSDVRSISKNSGDESPHSKGRDCLAVVCAAMAIFLPILSARAAEPGKVSGELKRWHRVTIDFAGPETSERAEPNPFRDFRLDVTFTHEASARFLCGRRECG